MKASHVIWLAISALGMANLLFRPGAFTRGLSSCRQWRSRRERKTKSPSPTLSRPTRTMALTRLWHSLSFTHEHAKLYRQAFWGSSQNVSAVPCPYVLNLASYHVRPNIRIHYSPFTRLTLMPRTASLLVE